MVRTRLELVLEQVSGQREIWDCTKLQAYAKVTLEHAKSQETRAKAGVPKQERGQRKAQSHRTILENSPAF